MRGRPRSKIVVRGVGAVCIVVAVLAAYFTSPERTAVSGTVTCAKHYPVVGVWIDSSNDAHDGWASWSPISGEAWKASYYKGGTHEAYDVHVGCGGTPQHWGMTAYSGTVTGHQDFTCRLGPTRSQRVCNS